MCWLVVDTAIKRRKRGFYLFSGKTASDSTLINVNEAEAAVEESQVAPCTSQSQDAPKLSWSWVGLPQGRNWHQNRD